MISGYEDYRVIDEDFVARFVLLLHHVRYDHSGYRVMDGHHPEENVSTRNSIAKTSGLAVYTDHAPPRLMTDQLLLSRHQFDSGITTRR
jgi:hypothetical protein